MVGDFGGLEEKGRKNKLSKMNMKINNRKQLNAEMLYDSNISSLLRLIVIETQTLLLGMLYLVEMKLKSIIHISRPYCIK